MWDADDADAVDDDDDDDDDDDGDDDDNKWMLQLGILWFSYNLILISNSKALSQDIVVSPSQMNFSLKS